ncbi:hypothetical protein HDIA_3504 [Hartmannibacter diazotrophicus]|uniref:Uncharacterized protein n=1 Tax=Hartmannibacter diazotrophicus TaxID=1482074 RepID=A0A2C9DBR2_9HYPH|nr:hypothetical protein [Hartmannibacter diazotrophicus]SON57045.1 hypothetical protein HDIA_3504 [Hartmannibacter diazotrophicus]
MASALRDGVSGLDVTMRLTLAVLALASGVYTYLGVRDLLDGAPVLTFLAALIYSAAVSVAIFAFWSFLMRFLPHVKDVGSRIYLTIAMALGALMIVAMSSWLNAAALAGSAAIEQHLAVTLQAYTRDLDAAHNRALGAQSLLPDIQLASTRFARLAEAERGGALTGTGGSGTVVQLLSQMSTQLDDLGNEVKQSADRAKSLYEEGGGYLAQMRELVSGQGPIKARSDAFAAEALKLVGTIAALEQTSMAPAVKRAADDLASGFIAPAADGRTADLAGRQTEVVGSVEKAVSVQAGALAKAADAIASEPAVEPARFQPLSTAEAVLRYAGDFLPSWAGAISIDLLPAVLVLILCVVEAAIRREGRQEIAETMSAADLIAAMRLLREVDGERALAQAERLVEPEADTLDAPTAAADASVTQLPPRGLKRE